MYRIEASKKADPRLRWALPDRVFFACGACHILAHTFLERYDLPAAEVLWIRPDAGYTGNHIVVAHEDWIFDHHGYCDRDRHLDHMRRKARRWWPGWAATLVPLPRDVLISEAKSKTFEGLWLREPGQFLFDPIPRARAFLDRFPPPPHRSTRVTVEAGSGDGDHDGPSAAQAVASSSSR